MEYNFFAEIDVQCAAYLATSFCPPFSQFVIYNIVQQKIFLEMTNNVILYKTKFICINFTKHAKMAPTKLLTANQTEF